MVQLQILNRVLDTKDMKLLVENNLTEEYFIEYPDEYAFIKIILIHTVKYQT